MFIIAVGGRQVLWTGIQWGGESVKNMQGGVGLQKRLLRLESKGLFCVTRLSFCTLTFPGPGSPSSGWCLRERGYSNFGVGSGLFAMCSVLHSGLLSEQMLMTHDTVTTFRRPS